MIERPNLSEIEEARERLAGVAARTPLVPMHSYDGQSRVHLKLEIHQPVTSFKIRGVFNAVAALSPERRSKGILTTSAGNTAQALAWCGRHFGVEARSLMPETAPQTKIDAVRAYGGTPILVTFDELMRFMLERGWESDEAAFIHPWTDRDVLIGHATAGLEIIEDLPDVEAAYIPVGGGGLIGGVGSALKALKPSLRVIAVEPEGCPALARALDAGHPVNVECRTICDGVAVPFMTEEVFPLLRDLIDDIVLVSEEEVMSTIRRLAFGNRIIVEGAAALAPAAAARASENGPVVAMVTGGSIDQDRLMDILAG